MPNPEQCRFAKTHEWIFAQGNQATVGLSDHAQREISDVVYVELPVVGRKLKAGESCAVVESVKAAFDVYAPVSGTVTEVNQELHNDVSRINQSPYEKGWMFRLEMEDPSQWSRQMDHAAYQEFVKSAASSH
ncbi:MAG: glycine cleavage system protein GcvH [Elusimicrobia bacterium]|nr:glycine cleavage system protein GcvH [Elusimicrobiota bacterium]